jgi:hypothetical protein
MPLNQMSIIKQIAVPFIWTGYLLICGGCAPYVSGQQYVSKRPPIAVASLDKSINLSESLTGRIDKKVDPFSERNADPEKTSLSPEQSSVAKVKIKSVRAVIREKPSHKSKSIISINRGEEVEKQGQEKNWLKVRYKSNNSDVEGWIHKCHFEGYPNCSSLNPEKNKKPETNKKASPI